MFPFFRPFLSSPVDSEVDKKCSSFCNSRLIFACHTILESSCYKLSNGANIASFAYSHYLWDKICFSEQAVELFWCHGFEAGGSFSCIVVLPPIVEFFSKSDELLKRLESWWFTDLKLRCEVRLRIWPGVRGSRTC